MRAMKGGDPRNHEEKELGGSNVSTCVTCVVNWMFVFDASDIADILLFFVCMYLGLCLRGREQECFEYAGGKEWQTIPTKKR